jgi:hypothetical protein
MRRGGQDGHEEDVVSVGKRSGVVKRQVLRDYSTS